MTLTEQIYAQALVLVQDLEDGDEALLEVLCRSAENYLAGKLRSGIEPENCRADFVAAASLYAVAALSETVNARNPEQVDVGDMTIRRPSANAAACCLRYQAQMLMSPYMKDGFAFLGV